MKNIFPHSPRIAVIKQSSRGSSLLTALVCGVVVLLSTASVKANDPAAEKRPEKEPAASETSWERGPLWPMTEIPEWENNPYVNGSLDQVKKRLAKPDITFLKGEEGIKQLNTKRLTHDFGTRKTGLDIVLFAWAALYPESPYKGNEEILDRAIRRADAYSEAYLAYPLKGTFRETYTPLNDFFALNDALFGMLILLEHAPDKLTDTQKENWRAMAQKAAEVWLNYIENLGGYASEENPRGMGSFTNHDLGKSGIIELAGLILDRPEYMEPKRKVIEYVTEEALFPDGGLAYIRKQNESVPYHQDNVKFLVRSWELTGNPKAMELLHAMRNYYPLSMAHGNVYENWSAPSWKTQWHSGSLDFGPEIMAGVTGSPQVRYLAQTEVDYRNGLANRLEPAPYYRSKTPLMAPPDNFLVYDRNQQGPRAKFGRFLAAGTARDVGSDDTGKLTYVGAVVSDPIDGKRYPLNSAVMAVYPKVKTRKGPDEWRTTAHLPTKEKNAVSMGATFSGLSTSHGLCGTSYGPGQWPSDWGGQQEWLIFPDRMVGLVEVAPETETAKAQEVTGRVRLGYGRSGALRPKKIERLSENLFEYGDLRVKMGEHNFSPELEIAKAGVLRDSPKRATEIILRDKQSERGSEWNKKSYRADEPYYFAVEIYPEWAKPAEKVDVISLGESVKGLQVRDEGRNFLLLHNSSSEAQTVTPDLSSWGKMARSLHRSVDVEQPGATPTNSIPEKLSIPPHSHVVIVGSPNEADHGVGAWNFDEILEDPANNRPENAVSSIKELWLGGAQQTTESEILAGD